MTQKQKLQQIYDDLTSHTCCEIHLIWSDGSKAGIGNSAMIAKVMKLLIDELKTQIDETENSK